MIRIKCDESLSVLIRKYKIVLDGEDVGRIGSGEVKEIAASPGFHTLVLKLDWNKSKTLEFEIEETPVEFTCGPAVTLGSALLLGVFAAKRYGINLTRIA